MVTIEIKGRMCQVYINNKLIEVDDQLRGNDKPYLWLMLKRRSTLPKQETHSGNMHVAIRQFEKPIKTP